MKKLKAMTLLMICMIAVVPSTIYADDAIQLTLNGNLSQLKEYEPYIDDNNRTMISIRWVDEQLNYKVDWKGETQTALVNNGTVELSITANDNRIITNSGTITMDTEAIIKNGRLFIPIRFLAKGFGLEVRWNDTSKMVYLIDPEKILYEEAGLKLGALLPEGMNKSDYRVERNDYEGYSQISFYSANINGHLLTLSYYDRNFWEAEVKNNFPLIYNEIYSSQDKYLISVLPSDVQYNPENEQEKTEYEKLFSTVDNLYNSVYVFTN